MHRCTLNNVDKIFDSYNNKFELYIALPHHLRPAQSTFIKRKHTGIIIIIMEAGLKSKEFIVCPSSVATSEQIFVFS